LKVNAGDVVDPSFHLTLFTAPDDLDPWLESTWRLANPALGDFRSIDDVRRLATQAKELPSKEAAFRNLILNQRVDGVAQFLTAGVWKACGGAVDMDRLAGRPCFGALDWGASRDLTALILVLDDDDGGFDILPYFWLPGDSLAEREGVDKVPYRQWKAEGHLQAMPGKTNDPAVVARKIAELHGLYNIKSLAYDRWRIEDLRRELNAIGCDVELVPHGQGFRDMSPAIEALERHVVAATIRHSNHPILTWNAANAVAVSDPAGGRKLDKAKSHGRIDGVISLAMALNIATRNIGQEDWVPFIDII
jgi:phage terminase large subunit-like protein